MVAQVSDGKNLVFSSHTKRGQEFYSTVHISREKYVTGLVLEPQISCFPCKSTDHHTIQTQVPGQIKMSLLFCFNTLIC